MAVKEDVPYLLNAVQSITSQSLKPLEILIVIDGFDSNARELKLQLREKFCTASILENSGRGMVSALNLGIENSRADYLAFLDADDIWLPNKQADQIALLDANLHVDVVTGLASNNSLKENRNIADLHWQQSMMFTSATFRKSSFTKYGMLDAECTHFTWLYRWWTHAMQLGITRITLNKPSTVRRIHSENSWRLENVRAKKELLTELRRIMNPVESE